MMSQILVDVVRYEQIILGNADKNYDFTPLQSFRGHSSHGVYEQSYQLILCWWTAVTVSLHQLTGEVTKKSNRDTSILQGQ